MTRQRIIVIAGPTASGKSGLAVQTAAAIDGTVVNADATQVYRDLTIVSARPTPADMMGVPHVLYGYVDAYTQNTVQDWLRDVIPVLQNTPNPVVVGGTGLYIGALVNGMHTIPDIDPAIRAQVRAMPLDDIRRQVPDCRFTDPQRLQRALEVYLSTGKPLPYFYKQPKVKPIDADFTVVFLNPDRQTLYTRCDTRFHQMIERGALDEVRALMALHPTGGVLKAIGVPEIAAYLRGKTTYDEMITAATTATRHYAKRQITWFRHQLTADIITTAADADTLHRLTNT